MKGFYIFEEEFNKGTVDCLKIGYIDHTFTTQINSGTLTEEVKMHALASKGTKTKCSPDDTYDFEIGALIALMKMCGVEKVVRACNEAFPKERYNTYIAKFESELNSLSKKYDEVTKYCDSLREANKGLQEEVKRLKGESENHWKKYQRNIQKKQDRINELEKAYKASNDDEAKLVEYYQCEIKKFEAENKDLKKNIDELFESEQHTKSELGRLYFEKHRLEEEKEKLKDEIRLKNDAINEWKQALRRQNDKIGDLVCENYKLKTDCEKLQHGYNDMMFCGGRQNGKQYTFLVDLFKKIDQKKVDAAYKEAYNTELPVWQKEFFKQMYDITVYRKTELPRTLEINGTTYRKTIIPLRDDQIASLLDSCKYASPVNKLTVDSLIEQSRAFTRKCVDEWLYKIPTRREHMWEKIFKLHKVNNVIIEVEREDVSTFLQEIESRIPKITWASGEKIFKTKYTIVDIYGELKTHNRMYFRLSIDNKLSYSSDPDIYLYKDLEHISYLPPMRWDLFKKGRIVIKVEKENYGEFCSRMFAHFDKVGVHAFNHDCEFGYFVFNKDTNYVERILSSDCGQIKDINRRKIVDWEDVR